MCHKHVCHTESSAASTKCACVIAARSVGVREGICVGSDFAVSASARWHFRGSSPVWSSRAGSSIGWNKFGEVLRL